MNRFTRKSLPKRIAESVNFSIVFFIGIIVIFIVGITILSSKNNRDERDVLEKALNKDIVHCYAVEGYYPPSLAYIEEHYGLTYDHSKYIVDYESVGANIMPTVTILEKNSK